MMPSLFRIILQTDRRVSQSAAGMRTGDASSYLKISGRFFTLPPLASVMALSTSAWIRLACRNTFYYFNKQHGLIWSSFLSKTFMPLEFHRGVFLVLSYWRSSFNYLDFIYL